MKWFAIGLIVSGLAYGAPTQTLSTSVAPSAPPSAQVIGVAEFRPSYRSTFGEVHTENNIVLGYRFDRDRYLSYRQEYNTNLYEPRSQLANGMSLTATDGYLRGGIANIWQAESMPLSFNYEGRLYAPTFAVRRDAGMITALRTYLRWTYRFSDKLSISLDEVPVIPVYDRAGAVVNGRAVANPAFENKVELVTVYNFAKDFVFILPFKYTASRNRDFSKAARANGTWGQFLQIWPEVWYTVGPNARIGAAYYTDNLVHPTFSGFTLDNGIRNSVTQFIFSANL